MPSPHVDRLADCLAEGLTAPETAARLGIHQTTVYKWANQQGVTFANRKRPPQRLTPAQEARRKDAQKAAMQRRRDAPVNGWTWAQLIDAGFTATEAAKMRGQTIEAAYAAERVIGRKFYRVHIQGLALKDRRRMHRIRRDYGVTRDTALEIIRRPDLIQPRPDEQVRRAARIKSDPEAALLAMMHAAGQATR